MVTHGLPEKRDRSACRNSGTGSKHTKCAAQATNWAVLAPMFAPTSKMRMSDDVIGVTDLVTESGSKGRSEIMKLTTEQARRGSHLLLLLLLLPTPQKPSGTTQSNFIFRIANST